jgi:glucosylceramidase
MAGHKTITASNNEFDRRTLLRQAGCFAAGVAAILSVPVSVRRAVAQTALQTPPQVQSSQSNPAVWIATTQTAPWQTKSFASSGRRGGMGGFGGNSRDLEVLLDAPCQTIDGFGACFNELGWTSLQTLSAEDRENIMREMFAPGVGGNFTICRMPVGANDFSRDWYSYDETPEDFALDHFSIANDLETLVPFIKSAQKHNPALRLWASPWSPPTWMKRNKNYAAVAPRPAAGANASSPARGGPPEASAANQDFDLFVKDDRYYKTYAAYFGRFIDAYKRQGINIEMVMPQNEFNSAQRFPSCTWTPEALAHFVKYLGPEMSARKVQVFFGTLERANKQMLETVLKDPQAGQYIKGVGVQWAGKGAIATIHKQYPEMRIYQTEQECGDGRNEWGYCTYAWDLMKHYFKNGVNSYEYWNLSLQSGGSSHWGWKQNSFVSVDIEAKTYHYNHEYFLMKHLSHFVQPGARRLETQGTFDNALAFVNLDKSVAVALRNEGSSEKAVNLSAGTNRITISMEPDSFNTVLLSSGA